MMQTDDLPCPQCGSTLTLSKLRIKREQLKHRLKVEAQKRYPPPPPKSTKGGLLFSQVQGCSSGHISLAPQRSQSYGEDLVISVPASHDPSLSGTVVINDAVLDVCMHCGTFYSGNAARLREAIETEIAEMDPLGALAEIRQPTEVAEG